MGRETHIFDFDFDIDNSVVNLYTPFAMKDTMSHCAGYAVSFLQGIFVGHFDFNFLYSNKFCMA